MTKKFITEALVNEIIEDNNLDNLRKTKVEIKAKRLILNIGHPSYINMKIAMGGPKKNKDLWVTAYAKEIFTGGVLEEQDTVFNEADTHKFIKITQLLIKLEQSLANRGK